MIPAGYRNFNSEHVPGKTKLFEIIYDLRRYTFSVTNYVTFSFSGIYQVNYY